MLKSRLQIIIGYLHSQGPSYLTDASIPVATDNVPDHKILRSIYALAAQVNLTAPSDVSGMPLESARTQTNAELIGLLSSLTRSMADIKTLGDPTEHGGDAEERQLCSHWRHLHAGHIGTGLCVAGL